MEAAINRCNHGANVKRWREWRGISQNELAEKLGMPQPRLSVCEQKAKLDDELITKIANELDIPVEAITEMPENPQVNIFSGTFSDNEVIQANNHQPTFNPIDKLVELYDNLLQAEREKVAMLQEMLNGKK